MNTVHT